MNRKDESQRAPSYNTETEGPRCGRLYCDPALECTADNMLTDMINATGKPVEQEVQNVILEGCQRNLERISRESQR